MKIKLKIAMPLVLVDFTVQCTLYIEYFIIQSDVKQKIVFE